MTTTQSAPAGFRLRAITVLAIGCVLAALATGGLLAWHAATTSTSSHTHIPATSARTLPGDHSVEAGFARDMQIHHAQAVDMAMTIRDRSSDPAIRTLAYDIALTQQEQIGEMHGWLADWGLAQTGADPIMSWMQDTGHDHAMPGMAVDGSAMTVMVDPQTGLMPGMATPAQLAALAAASGIDADIQFLTLMIAHHQAGVQMADAVLARTDRPSVTALATAMVNGQSSEISLMQDMLRERTRP
jgi:uncharacterized protein (DUF305 family)